MVTQLDGLIPPELLPILQNESAVQFDTLADWYSAGPPDIHGDRQYPATPTQIPSRFVKQVREFYTQGGQQAQVLEQVVYIPYNIAIKPTDKLVPHNTDVSQRWPTIIEISPMPSPATPVFLRVRQGAT